MPTRPKRWFRVIRTRWYYVLFVSALTWWCVSNVVYVLQRYFQFDTIISLDNQLPDSTDFPGITICAPSIFTPKRLAELYPDFKKSYQEFLHKKLLNPFEDLEEIFLQRRFRLFQKYESMALKRFTATEVIEVESVQLNELLNLCIFHPINHHHHHVHQQQHDNEGVGPNEPIDCTSYKHVLPSVYEGRKCFTYFSDLLDMRQQWINPHRSIVDFDKLQMNNCLGDDKACLNFNKFFGNETKGDEEDDDDQHKNQKTINQHLNKMIFDFNPNIEVRIKMNENLWQYIPNWDIKVSVHPPNVLSNRRNFLFFRVMKNSIYEVNFTKKTINLLPLPYHTRCIHYKSHPKYRQFRTKDECQNVCIKNFSYIQNGCANYFNVLTTVNMFNISSSSKEYICPHIHQNYEVYLQSRNVCTLVCPDECTKVIYELTGRVDTISDYECLHKKFSGPYDKASETEIATTEGITGQKLDFEDDDQDLTLIINASVHLNALACYTRVVIRISPQPFQVVNYRPAISYEEFVGIIGGHIGIWLGMSVYSIVNFTIRLMCRIVVEMLKLLCCIRLINFCRKRFLRRPRRRDS